jgi:hypothetical protein
MPTPYESARLILQLYELRREPRLRDARSWFLKSFNPDSFEGLVEGATANNDAFRMVLGYWDMAASLVTAGAIDADMFRAGNNEMMATFAKIAPYLAELRAATGIPEFATHMEAIAMGMPGAEERLALLRQQWREAAAQV